MRHRDKTFQRKATRMYQTFAANKYKFAEFGSGSYESRIFMPMTEDLKQKLQLTYSNMLSNY